MERGEKRGGGSGGGGGGGGWLGVGVGQTGTAGVNPSTHTSPQHSAALNATHGHGEAHLLVLYHSALLKENYCS